MRSINLSRSFFEFSPKHWIFISVPLDAAKVIRPKSEDPLTILFPFLTRNFDLHFEVSSTNFAAALACKPNLLVIRIFFSNLFSCNYFSSPKKAEATFIYFRPDS